MSSNKPVYKGREFYYKKESPKNVKEGYSYTRNQPLGSGPMHLSVENYEKSRNNPPYHNKPREYPGVL